LLYRPCGPAELRLVSELESLNASLATLEAALADGEDRLVSAITGRQATVFLNYPCWAQGADGDSLQRRSLLRSVRDAWRRSNPQIPLHR
jgi:hypothetical protein